GAAPAPVPDADGWWLHQAHDSRYTLRGPDGVKQGERAMGVAVAEDQQARVTVTMRDFQQTYPSGLAIKPDGVHVRLLPPLAPDTYADAESQKWFMQLYPWFRDGKYLVRAGQLIQGEIYVDYSRPGIGDAARLAAWQRQPLLPLAPPSYLMETAVLGRAIFPRTAGVWDSYEQYFDRGFEATEQDRQRQRSFGWMHYGDWYGERGFNYGNNEYDLPWAVGLQWLRSGDRRLFDRGQQMARHYSTTDTVHGRFSDSWNGLVFEHSFNHIGVDLKPDDPRMQKGEYADYLQRYGASMFQGAIDRQGHVFQAGNWLYAALTGDRFLRDVAARVSLNQAEKLTPRFDFSIERAGGWPLINMTMAHAFTGNPYYLNAARLMIERTLDRQDPATGGWLHRPPADEVDGEQVLGGKAFAVGILTHGILRYLEQEPESRPEVTAMLVRGVDWLMNESWNPGKGFRYISNARTYANSGGRGGTSLLNAEAVAFAYEQTKDPKYLAFWRDMMQAQLDGSPGGMGKGFAMAVRQTVYGLDRVRAYGINEAPRQATVLLRERAELRDGQAAVRVAVD
ncbi:MAG: hypothetical protein HUU35_19570, partial [Armatimonadetes bacterium]|nr:hypothetical protein [Armatimonadota bacterium]